MKRRKVLSSLLAIFAFGIWTNVSAESYIVDEAPDTFTSRSTGRITGATAAKDNTKDAVLANGTISALNGGSGYNVIDYHGVGDKATYKAFCIDRKKLYAQSKTYKKDSEITDYGIVYIIAHAQEAYNSSLASTAVELKSGTTVYESIDEVKQMELAWLTQIAIWRYQDAEFKLPSNTIEKDIFEDTVNIPGNSALSYNYSTRADELWSEAGKLVNSAKSAKKASSLEFSFEGKYELNKDAKTMKTGVITSPVAGFGLDLSKAPKGTKAFDESGKEIDSNNINVTKFYLVFPIDNVTNYTFDFNVPATTIKGGDYTGYKYVTTEGDYQPLVLVTPTKLAGTINFKGSHVEDTASMISKSIYLIGFLVLLAGVGLIYANVKPNKEQA